MYIVTSILIIILGMFLGYSVLQLMDYCLAGVGMVKKNVMSMCRTQPHSSVGCKCEVSILVPSSGVNGDELAARSRHDITE